MSKNGSAHSDGRKICGENQGGDLVKIFFKHYWQQLKANILFSARREKYSNVL